MNEERLAELRQAKLRGLVRGGFDGTEGVTAPFRSGASLVAEGAASVLIDRAETDSLGGAMVWFARHQRPEHHVIVECETEVAAVLARQAAQFVTPVTVWQVIDHAVAPVIAADPPGPPVAPPAGAAGLIAMLDDVGVDIVVEHGVIKGEVLGLEVARVVDGPAGCVLEVGVGRFDREMAALMHANLPTAEALGRAVELVRTYRHAGATRHPLRDLVPERWVRTLVIEDPAMVGAATLSSCDTTIEPPNLRVPQPAAAIGIDDGGRPVVVVCSVGVDVDLVPIAADTRAWHDPESRLVLAVAMAGLPPVLGELAASLRLPADVVELAPLH